MHQYYIIYKPFRVLSQFSVLSSPHSSSQTKQTLKDIFDVAKDVYPVGRLDYDSEGLLLLTNDTSLNKQLLDPANAHEREYWVQVEGLVDKAALNYLQAGVEINIDGKPYRTKKARAMVFDSEPVVPERDPPIRFRQNIPTSWIKLILTEGKNRQVRKMTASAGFPTLRLIRYRIGNLSIATLEPGNIKQLGRTEIYSLLFG